MKKKTVFIAIVALVSLVVFFTLQLQVDFTSTPIQVSLTEHAHAQSDCPLCPDPSELEMRTFICSSGELGQKCWFDGNGCDVSAQIPCPDPEEN